METRKILNMVKEDWKKFTASNEAGNRVMVVYGKHEHQEHYDNQTVEYFDGELFVNGQTQGLELISLGQLVRRYPIFVSTYNRRVIVI